MTPNAKNMILGNTARGVAPSVSAGYAKALIDFAVANSVSEADLLSSAGIAASALLDLDNRIPLDRFAALMRHGKAMSGNPAFALEFGAASDFRRFSVVGLIAHASATMTEALTQLNRYGRLVIDVEGVGNGPRFQLHHTNGQCWMQDCRINPNEFPELTETTWSRFICWTKREFPQATYALEAHVTHARPEYAEAYERLWQVPVTFGSHWNAIRRTLSWGDVEIAPHNRYAFGVLTDRGDALLQELEHAQTMRGRVEALLLPRLHTGEASIDAVAAHFGSSRQTIYRSLKAEGVTFEQVLDELRRRMASHYLNAGKVSVNETAYLVGFSDPASFSRAFKRWTGMSPRAARTRAS